LDYSQDVDDIEIKNNSTSNYLVPILASVGATSIILGCSCALGYYWHINGVDINRLPLPYRYFGGFNYPETL
jgi:hypothetical protein